MVQKKWLLHELAREIDGFLAYFAGNFALDNSYLERYKQIGKAA